MIKCPICGHDNRDTAKFCGKCSAPLGGTTLLPIGTIMQGRYKVVSVLGQGGMGAVYLVEDQRLFDKKLALKELVNTLPDPAARAQALQQFQQEARLLAYLSHPNLPHISDYFAESGRQYLVMEYVDGETLEAILGKTSGFLPEAQVVEWAIQVCDALEYLHSQSPPIIFRDLKPANIMLDKDKRIKLIDFGIARLFQPGKAKDTHAMGTPGYAAPEQYGTGQSDARTDIYALGATLHHLLTKRDPAVQPFTFPLCKSLNPAVSGQMDAIIGKAVAADPTKRYQTMSEVRTALLGLNPGAVRVLPASLSAGITGPTAITWTQTAPLPTFTAYCGTDKRETVWLQEPGGKCTCTECAASYHTGAVNRMLQAFCKKCGVQTTRVISSGTVSITRCNTRLVQVDISGKTAGAYYCPNCRKTTSWDSRSVFFCTCLGCGSTAYIEGNITGAVEVFCAQCKAKTPWLTYVSGRVCLWCGTKV